MEKILAELKAILFARPTDFLNWQDGKLELKDLADIPKKSRGAIAKIERSTTGVKVVFHDKLKAAELLLRFSQLQSPAEKNNLLEAIIDSINIEKNGEESVNYDNGISLTEGS
jgi:hypothetical protein